MKFLTFLILMIILISTPIMAIGMTGALKKEQIFIPGEKVYFSYIVSGNKEYAVGYDMYAKLDKELQKYVVFDKKRVENIPAGNSFPMKGYIDLPASLDPPGWHEVQICAREDCPVPGMVCGRTAVCGRMRFYVLYDGKYPILDFNTHNVKENEPIEFTARIKNDGKENIRRAEGHVDVYDIDDKKLGSASFDSKSINSTHSAAFTTEFDTIGLSPGNYSAEAVFDVDGQDLRKKKTFRIGTLNVKILGHDTEIEKGGIKPFKVTVESDWGDPLRVNADIKIKDDGSTIINTKSATGLLEPWQTLDLEAFIDTSKLEEKEYDVEIITNYAGKTSRKEGKINITAASTTVSTTEQEPEKGSSSIMLTVILVIVVLVLTLVNVVLAIYRKKK